MSNNPIFLNSGEGISYWVLGDRYTFKVTGKDTNGEFAIMDQIIHPQGGPPPHIHRREDESFFILDGKFSFLCDGKESVYSAGSFVYIPKGTLHTFKNIDDKPGRLLVTITPAGLEDFFYAIGTPTSESPEPPAFDPSVIDKIMQLSKVYQMDVMLP